MGLIEKMVQIKILVPCDRSHEVDRIKSSTRRVCSLENTNYPFHFRARYLHNGDHIVLECSLSRKHLIQKLVTIGQTGNPSLLFKQVTR
ncbi:hypothetical protein A7Q26_07825 [Sphingobium sp. TCM1]|nr:hypothetical protein A7Q26_07825 [Sphingobium sp. TCM1]